MKLKHRERRIPELSTAALPDLIFTILFFFILVTHLRSVDVKVRYQLPEGEQLTKMKVRNNILQVFVSADGVVQIGGDVVPMNKIASVVYNQAEQYSAEGNSLLVSFKADKKTKMSVVTQVKNELRKVAALKINYNALNKNTDETKP